MSQPRTPSPSPTWGERRNLGWVNCRNFRTIRRLRFRLTKKRKRRTRTIRRLRFRLTEKLRRFFNYSIAATFTAAGSGNSFSVAASDFE